MEKDKQLKEIKIEKHNEEQRLSFSQSGKDIEGDGQIKRNRKVERRTKNERQRERLTNKNRMSDRDKERGQKDKDKT